MESITIKWVGWCNKGTSDKVWGYFQVGARNPGWGSIGPYYIFWGGRGKALNFKKVNELSTAHSIQRSKENRSYDKAYTEISEAKLLEIWPTFENELEGRLSFCMLANKIK